MRIQPHVSILFLNVAIAVCVVVLLSVAAVARATSKHDVSATPSHQQQPPHQQQGGDPNFPPLLPMWWDASEGAYMVDLGVGQGLVSFVVDTGSSHLSAKGVDCKWTTCGPAAERDGDADECETRPCPCSSGVNDCTPYAYRPGSTHRQISTHMSTMTYGSQTDQVQHFWDFVRVPNAWKITSSCDMLTIPPRPLDQSAYFENADPSSVARFEVVVYRVRHINGTSASNMLGLAPPPRLRGGKTTTPVARTVLEFLWDQTAGHQLWSFWCHEHAKWGWLALGKVPCFADRTMYVPLVQPKSMAALLTHFYVIPLLSIRVGPSPSALRQVTPAPQYALVDTGTTCTYGSPGFGRALDGAGFTESSWYFEMTLGTSRSSSKKLLFAPHEIQDPDIPSQSIIQAWEGRTLDEYTTIFPERRNGSGGVLLWGALMMQGMYMEFDIGQRKFGIVDARQRG